MKEPTNGQIGCTGAIFLALGTIAIVFLIVGNVLAKYHYLQDYGNLWNLADKSSDIKSKAQYIENFITALETGDQKGEFADHDAIWLATPDNAFADNLRALRTLGTRLQEIQGMDPRSFEYNTAIQQITAQEQGDAYRMLTVFTGCYKLANYPWLWGWIAGIEIGFIVIFVLVGILGFLIWSDQL